MEQPERIGQYRIRRRIGAGGMGVVYEAEQQQPKRAVAVKVMREELGSDEAVRRFEYEIEVLGRLKHPGVAAVHEAGTYAFGDEILPWFAMEFVSDAHNIREWCDASSLGPLDRVRLFLDVCDAIHHGHQRGVIHRDLKPENILINAAGRVKVIDYGIARQIDQDEQPGTRLTTHGDLVGTVQYMSPEQVGLGDVDVDVRTDVYSLGVVLYELLVGRLPYDLRSDHILENVSAIREGRKTQLRSGSEVPTDLGIVVDKAMEVERDRRYASVEAFARDLRHILAGEPISARRPSLLYQISTFARRNRAVFAGGLLAVAGLVIGLIVSIGMYMRADDARRSEAKAKDDALGARAESDAHRERAEAEADIAQNVNRFLRYVLQQANPEHGPGPSLTVGEAVKKAALGLEESFPDAPLTEAAVQRTVARTLLQLGMRAEAAPHFKRAYTLHKEHLGPSDPRTLVSLGDLGTITYHLGKLDEAVTYMTQNLEQTRKATGPESADTVRATQNLAFLMLRVGKTEEAEQMLAASYEAACREFGMEDPSIPIHLRHLAEARAELGRIDEAIGMTREALQRLETSLGPNHMHTATTLNALGLLMRRAGQNEASIAVFEDAVARQTKSLGADHPETLTTRHNLAGALLEVGRSEDAIAGYRETLAGREKCLPIAHAHIRHSRTALARALWSAGERIEAIALERETHRRAAEQLGPEHHITKAIAEQLAAWEVARDR